MQSKVLAVIFLVCQLTLINSQLTLFQQAIDWNPEFYQEVRLLRKSIDLLKEKLTNQALIKEEWLEELNNIASSGCSPNISIPTDIPTCTGNEQYNETCTCPSLDETYEANVKNSFGLRDCAEIKSNFPDAPSGVYTILLLVGERISVQVYCDMETNGGGWTVLQRRIDGSIAFYLPWTCYQNGFGNLYGEFWLGNDNIAALTAKKIYTLRIELGDWVGKFRWAEYFTFRIAGAWDKYRLNVTGYSGTAGDGLMDPQFSQNGRQFSTYDNDNDLNFSNNCAVVYRGAWWYIDCHRSNLNGEYNNTMYGKGINWYSWHGDYYSLKFAEMKIRPGA